MGREHVKKEKEESVTSLELLSLPRKARREEKINKTQSVYIGDKQRCGEKFADGQSNQRMPSAQCLDHLNWQCVPFCVCLLKYW